MSMSTEDFLTGFSEKELKTVKLTTWKGKGDGIIHLKALPYSEVARFQSAADKIMQRKMMSAFAKDPINYEEELGRAEDYLIKASVCDSQGNLIFADGATFNKWRDNVSNQTVNEIIAHIRELTDLSTFFDIKKAEAELKKKSKSLDSTQ